MQIADLLRTLRDEIALVEPEGKAWLRTLAGAEPGSPSFDDALDAYVSQLERTAATCEMLGLAGLQAFFEVVQQAAEMMASLPADRRSPACDAHAAWIAPVLAYLDAPEEAARIDALMRWPDDPRLGHGLDAQARAALRARFDQSLALPTEFLNEVLAPKPVLGPEDLSLAVPEDVDRSIYDAFVVDAPEQAATLALAVARLIAGHASEEEMREARRIAHSFKGAAHIIGVRGLGTLAHRLEDVLDILPALPPGMAIPRGLARTLVDATAALEQMVGALLGTDEPPEDADETTRLLIDWAYAVEHEGWTQAAARLDGEPAPRAAGAGTALPPALALEAFRVARTTARDDEGMLRIAARTMDEMLRLVGELNTKIAQVQTQLRQAQTRQRQLLAQNRIVQTRIAELDRAVAVRGVSLELGRAKGEALDPLELDRYNELYSATHALMEANADFNELGQTIDVDLAQLGGEVVLQERLGKDLQYLAMSTRMLPVSTLQPRLARAVRQTARTTGKEAELEVLGGEILVDADVLQQVAEPLLHILRNAVDHGIEPPDVRELKGKPRTGRIELAFSREGSAITVSCRDDGRGLNYDRIRSKAVEQGLIEASAALDEEALARLILLPGFTTRDKVTEVSGRGVGMDVVLARIQQLGGAVEVRSRGQGTEVKLRFQSSLVIQFVLLVKVADQVFALPSGTVSMALAAGSGEIRTEGEAAVFEYAGRRYRLRALAERLGVVDEGTAAAWRERPILIVRGHQGEEALAVQQVVDSREVLLKPLGRYLDGLAGVLGVAILGDGAIAPVLDLPQLLRDEAIYRRMLGIKVAGAAARRNAVLVVDDSLSVRRALSQLMADAGYEVRTAKDGLDAIALLNDFSPSVVLTDLEMPNMNGLELTAHLRARPEWAGLPIVMITSRSMEKHRRLAAQAGVTHYMTKPYTDDRLLDVVAGAVRERTSA